LKDGAARGSTDAGAASNVDRDRERVLACARCRRPITTRAAQTEVNGSHVHTFDNPDGDRFRIACFSDADGLLRVGPSTREWTWFAGYTWQVQVCAGCRVQLGWLYRCGEHRFHGLILDGLVELDGN
jgi:uncharacterized C2H2 Zn-finger protein